MNDTMTLSQNTLPQNQSDGNHPAATPYAMSFAQIKAADLPIVGGKGANLGEMTQAGFPVPPGFCVTTAAFRKFMAGCPEAEALYTTLADVESNDLEAVRTIGARIRQTLVETPIPPDVAEAVLDAWRDQGTDYSYAVRSSATAEDLPDASFAGQQDTFLNVQGEVDLLESVRKCWASLFTDRAITYRIQNQFDHREVLLAVVVQQMILPDVSGILFTADPVSGNRQIATIDASYGLGEALVSGIVSADLYKIDKRTMTEIEAVIGDKQLAIWPLKQGGTVQETLDEAKRLARVLSSTQVATVAAIGTQIEAHYGQPQDIEWAMAENDIFIVQSRPITSLYPLPDPAPADDEEHIYLSFSHAQVMTDPMPPMARSIWQQALPFGRHPTKFDQYNPHMASAGGRLYLDVTAMLNHPLARRLVIGFLGNADNHIAQTLADHVTHPDFHASSAQSQNVATLGGLLHWLGPTARNVVANLIWRQPEGRATALTQWSNQTYNQIKIQLDEANTIESRLSVANHVLGSQMGDIIRKMLPNIAAGFAARGLLMRLLPNDHLDIDLLTRGLSGNVTTDMDLQVGDLADIARRSPQIVELLQGPDPVTAFDSIEQLEGEAEFVAAWDQFLERYGMRGPSEIDISRPRWRDDPSSLIQVIASNLQQSEAGVHRRQHQQMTVEGEAAMNRLVAAARPGPLGRIRARLVHRLARVIRNLMAIREHPKFLIIQVFAVIRETILEAATALRAQDRIDSIDDIWYLDLHELIAVMKTPDDDVRPRIAQRKANMARYWDMRPPRVMLSTGEIPVLKQHRTDFPAGALAGSPVSAGTIEGIAHVVTDPTREQLNPGEILVAPFTDPGWTPLFINAAGLVMEVGGLMTHGSVVAREYGIPAVVGVLDATQRIKTGQRIRVHGDQGYVEILDQDGAA